MTAPTPWALAPLEGKYYQTTIIDAEGVSVCDIARWGPDRSPSPRESTPEDEICDNHYETTSTYEVATRIIDAVNSAGARVPLSLAALSRIEALEKLLVCYRTGSRPTEILHRQLEASKAALAEALG